MREQELKKLKHEVLEILEGGLRGKPAARIFSWTLIILILLSIVFMIVWDVKGAEQWHSTFETIETITIGIFTLELVLGFWTADVRFPNHPRPHFRYMIDFMTVVQALAIFPFYAGLILANTRFAEAVEVFELLKLLHLLKIGEIGIHAAKEHGHGEKKKQQDESLLPGDEEN